MKINQKVNPAKSASKHANKNETFKVEYIMIYIQRKEAGSLETVDEYETRKEARSMLTEYRISDSSAYYYISTRACRDWTKS